LLRPARMITMTRRRWILTAVALVALVGLASVIALFFIDEPLRTYSAGMMMRLAFSVAVSADPDILLIDEVIGVGDQAFFAQCLEKIRGLQRAGKTVVLASHSMELLSMLCRRALWLDRGRVVAAGAAQEVVAAYRSGHVPVS